MHLSELPKKAAQLRVDTLSAIFKAGSGSVGGTMSVMEILTALYYGENYGRPVVNFDKMRPGWGDQDYIVLSKAHTAVAQYSILADLGFFDKEELNFYKQIGSMLCATPNLKIPGITVPSGACAQGFASAMGLAMSLKMERKDNKVFVVAGDEEMQKGLFWEAAMAAAHYKLNNLILFIDNNKFQASGMLRAVMEVDPIQDKFEAFGWQVIQVMQGHDFNEILSAVDRAGTSVRKPVCIWCHTLSGKGVSFAENKPYYHRSTLSEPEYNEAIANLQK